MSVNSKMTAIADAIRAKTGGTDPLTLDEMATSIEGIETGIDTSDATATTADILSGETAYVNGEKITGTIESRGNSDIINSGRSVTAKAGYYPEDTTVWIPSGDIGISEITVNDSGLITATPYSSVGFVYTGLGTPVTKQLTTQEAKAITPTKSTQTAVESGKYTTGAVTVAPIPSNYITTTDATAAANEILSGETAYVNGSKVTGTMANNGAISSTMDGINTKSVTVPAGYTSGGTVSLTDDIDNEVDTQADLISQIATALEGKAGGSSDDSGSASVTNSTVTVSGDFDDLDAFYNYIDEETGLLTSVCGKLPNSEFKVLKNSVIVFISNSWGHDFSSLKSSGDPTFLGTYLQDGCIVYQVTEDSTSFEFVLY